MPALQWTSRKTRNLQNSCKESRNLQNSPKGWQMQITAQRTEHSTVTQTQHIVQSQKATIQHTFQDHPAVQNQQDNTYDYAPTKASNLLIQNASRGPDHHASLFQNTQRATARPVI